MPDEMTIEEYRQYQADGTLPERYRKPTRMQTIAQVAETAPDVLNEAVAPFSPEKRKNKYNAIKTEVDGRIFASKREAARYQELRAMELAGAISNLEIEPRYVFVHNDIRIGSYRPDFRYWDVAEDKLVVEDIKSKGTKRARDYGLRIKMMAAFYGIDVKEVLY
jgi:hypothetical protein